MEAMNMKTLEGQLTAQGMKVAIVVARFNEFITSKLLSGAIDCLERHGMDNEDITAVWVPGAFEIPLAAQKLAVSGKYDAVICLGAVIRGSTPHFDYVCAEASKGVAHGAVNDFAVVVFHPRAGIDVVGRREGGQAVERAGTKAGNKGVDAAMTAIEMVNLLKNI